MTCSHPCYTNFAVALTKIQEERAKKREKEALEQKARAEEERLKREKEEQQQREQHVRLEEEEEQRKLSAAGWIDESKTVSFHIQIGPSITVMTFR